MLLRQAGHNFMLPLACRSIYKGLAYFSRSYLNRSYSVWLPLTTLTYRSPFMETNCSRCHVILPPCLGIFGQFGILPNLQSNLLKIYCVNFLDIFLSAVTPSHLHAFDPVYMILRPPPHAHSLIHHPGALVISCLISLQSDDQLLSLFPSPHHFCLPQVHPQSMYRKHSSSIVGRNLQSYWNMFQVENTQKMHEVEITYTSSTHCTLSIGVRLLCTTNDASVRIRVSRLLSHIYLNSYYKFIHLYRESFQDISRTFSTSSCPNVVTCRQTHLSRRTGHRSNYRCFSKVTVYFIIYILQG